MPIYLSLSSMFLAGVLLFFNWKVNRNALFLSLLMVLIATGQVSHYLILHATEPFWLSLFVNIPGPLWSMIGPCLYFYVRSVLTDRLLFRKKDWLHTLPFWINLVGTLPYLLTPFSYKIEMANLFIHNMTAAKNVRFNWMLGNEAALLSRSALQIGYALACLWMIFVFQRMRSKRPGPPSPQGRMIVHWLQAVSVFVLLVGVYYFIGVYLYYGEPSMNRNIVNVYSGLYFFGVVLTFLPSLVLVYPEILYGIPRKREASTASIPLVYVEPKLPLHDAAPDITSVAVEAETQTIGQNQSEVVDPMQELGQRVLVFMEREKPYLIQDFSIEDLADMLDVPRHHLYYCFKNILKTRFVTLRSEFRVREAQRRLLEADMEKNTFIGIGKSCGFASTSAFYRTFREVEGCTPGEFLERSKGGNNHLSER